MITPPTAWAVVPSGIGTLNIITRKLNADRIAGSGTLRVLTTLVTRRVATAQRVRFHLREIGGCGVSGGGFCSLR